MKVGDLWPEAERQQLPETDKRRGVELSGEENLGMSICNSWERVGHQTVYICFLSV